MLKLRAISFLVDYLIMIGIGGLIMLLTSDLIITMLLIYPAAINKDFLTVSDEVLKDFETKQIFIFTTETERNDSFVHCRMFAPSFGIVEDPATGSAHGPLGAYLVKYGLSDGKRFASEQGFEMGRPSIINVEVTHNKSKILNVKVGGKCIAMGKGSIQIDV